MEDMTVVPLPLMEDRMDILLTEYGGSKIFTILGQENMLLLLTLYLLKIVLWQMVLIVKQ